MESIGMRGESDPALAFHCCGVLPRVQLVVFWLDCVADSKSQIMAAFMMTDLLARQYQQAIIPSFVVHGFQRVVVGDYDVVQSRLLSCLNYLSCRSATIGISGMYMYDSTVFMESRICCQIYLF